MNRYLSSFAVVLILTVTMSSYAGTSHNIMMTGFWNPTGKMIAPFCTDPDLNPSGWEGENWEQSGFDVYSFFPTPGTYTGLFEVDYQEVWKDFWYLTDSLRPIAIISYGAGDGPWEIEYNARNLRSWYNDYKNPRQPTPAPPDSTVQTNYVRHSTLPMEEIRAAVDGQTTVNAWIDRNGDAGMFLCEYTAYLGMWYQSIHSSPDDSFQCQAAGFIHVDDSLLTLTQVKKATVVTLREVIKALNPSGILNKEKKLSETVTLQSRVSPNRFNVIITYYLPDNQEVDVNLFDCKGKLLGNLDRGSKSSGIHSVNLNSSNMAPGIYFCRLKTALNGVIGRKLVLYK